ncbi:MAG: hypothetical protein FH749_06335 [Firmicutes bacterium]|nr:hypothetical protein [Bacillota bacterium]
MEARKLGIILVTIGVVLLAAQFANLGRAVMLLVLAALGLAYYWQVNRSSGLLLASLIIGMVGLRSLFDLSYSLLPLLLGVAFILTWALHTRQQNESWPLIPGMILTLVGVVNLVRFDWVTNLDGRWLPLTVAVVFGVLYGFRRQLGFLIPALIALMLAAITFIPGNVPGGVFLGGFSLAFVGVLLIHTLHRGKDWGEKYWPIFPAGGLGLLALVTTLAESGFEDLFLPLFLGIPAIVLISVYFATRGGNLGLLIPGLMLGSVAAWFALGAETVSTLLFLLCGSFFLILILETRKEQDPGERWWPLIPGLVIGINGLLLWAGEHDLGNFQQLGSTATISLVLIGVGVLIILSGRKKPKTPE